MYHFKTTTKNLAFLFLKNYDIIKYFLVLIKHIFIFDAPIQMTEKKEKFKNPERYLTQEETKRFDDFLKKRKVSRVKIGSVLGFTGANVGYLLANSSFLRDDFKKVRKKLKDEALEDFKMIDDIE